MGNADFLFRRNISRRLRFWIFGGIVCGTAFFVPSAERVINPPHVLAQTVFELSCPASTTSIQSLQTFNISTGKLRQNYCVNSNGQVFENITGSSTNSNLNGILFVDGVTFPTIDSAIASVPSFNIVPATGCSESSFTVTCTTTTTHSLLVNQVVYISNVGVLGYNGFWTTIAGTAGTTIKYTNVASGLGTSGGGTIAPTSNIIIPSTYLGPEASTCSSFDNAGHDNGAAQGYTMALTPPNIHIEDRRGGSICNYNTSYNSGQIGARPSDISVARVDTSPNLTSSNIVSLMQYTGTLPSGQSLASITGETDFIGNVTLPAGIFVQVINGQWAVRSIGGTISQVMGIAGGGGIDRTFATTNIIQATGVYAFDPKNSSSSGATIAESYALIAALPTTGTRNNDAIFAQGPIAFSDNIGGIDVMNQSYVLPTGATAQKLIRYGGDNSQATAGVNQFSTAFGGVPYHFLVTAGNQTNWMICSACNVANTFEITPSTLAGGTTFSTPGFKVSNNGAGGASATAGQQGGISQVQNCGTTSACSKTSVTGVTLITLIGGPISLSAGTLTITSLPYTSSTSYVCSADDSTGINGIDVIYNSGASVTFNGTGTDSIRYECTGN